jgi:hypothetical protein
MSERIKCPSCGVALLLPVPLRGSRGTCPRCLAEVTALEVRREADAIQTEKPERREGALFLSALRPNRGSHLDNMPVVRGTVARSSTGTERRGRPGCAAR